MVGTGKAWRGELMKRTVEDAEFSEMIRARAGYKCERCGKWYGPKNAGLHCAHIFSRAIKKTRHDPLNAVALCFACHRFWAHSNPIEFAEWVRVRLGTRKYNALMVRAKRL
jgi:DNA-directed RNA polymerase subunit RPC12/RpoP